MALIDEMEGAWMDEARIAQAARKLCDAAHLAAKHPTKNTLEAIDRLASELESTLVGTES